MLKTGELLLMNSGTYLKGEMVLRVIKDNDSNVLVIDCQKRTMPFYVDKQCLAGYGPIDKEELFKLLDVDIPKYESLSSNDKRLVHERYGSISSIIPFVDDRFKRNKLIENSSKIYALSKVTIRKRLCDFLVFDDICIFVSDCHKAKKKMTENELNFRWALNKYFYTSLKYSLRETFERMLKDKYLDSNGKLLQNRPKFHQFKYFYYKNRSVTNYLISRNGKGDYERNNRPLLGEGIRDFCSSIGSGMLDSTICDIFLINDRGDLIGRPILTACVDGYSSMCLGYSVGLNGGISSLTSLMRNVICDKTKLCERFGIFIENEKWNCRSLPHKLITDKGREYTSSTFSQLTELGIEIINLPPYRPELKGAVEKFFDLVQGAFKRVLASKGVIFEDYLERGGIDYRKKASLTLFEFEKILLLCIINYNTARVIDLPYDLLGKVEPFAFKLWNWSINKSQSNLISIDDEQLRLILLPRVEAKFRRDGLIVNGLRYKNKSFKDEYLTKKKVIVAFDPNNVSKVYVIDNGSFIEFVLIESFFRDKTIEEVKGIKGHKKEIERGVEDIVISENIKLQKDIEAVISSVSPINVSIKNVRRNRRNIKKKGDECNE